MEKDLRYMQRCLQLARLGLGHTAPNPMVGAVVVYQDQIIGEGYHHKAGMPHAEVEAIRSVRDTSKLPDSTLYVNLEPCNHIGKTPPCTELILTKKIAKVVVGQTDPNPLVAGKGLHHLRQHGVEVTERVLEKEARELNRRFNTFHTKKRPFIILKWAKTSDGFIDFFREPGQLANPAWITDEYCRTLVHKFCA
ncbi:MAG: bifunctional diaminohydroxyphosphoribosylaminopyrimidine deaminase/5-amino-6-(5-phosphoribosylamino)uracil reductase RibD, partial [Bacteroidota bacterium]|nr:bifunctional diaminohydroxyphosphoribosylaminopyrimidine deaminase/5-amino-6-(5-phosphoribosylamino)uracil reductase RibD [Bacteroidota bacterium]